MILVVSVRIKRGRGEHSRLPERLLYGHSKWWMRGSHALALREAYLSPGSEGGCDFEAALVLLYAQPFFIKGMSTMCSEHVRARPFGSVQRFRIGKYGCYPDVHGAKQHSWPPSSTW